MHAPIGNQFGFQSLVLAIVQDRVEHHGANRKLLNARPGQGRGRAPSAKHRRRYDGGSALAISSSMSPTSQDCNRCSKLAIVSIILAGHMTRIFLAPLIAASLLLACPADAAPPTTRGNLIYDRNSGSAAGRRPRRVRHAGCLSECATGDSLGFTRKGQLLIVTRFARAISCISSIAHWARGRQITFLREPITQAAFSPDPNRNAFIYERDTAGDSNTQIYYQRAGDAVARRLTDGKSVNGAALWSNAGREIAFFTTARSGISYESTSSTRNPAHCRISR